MLNTIAHALRIARLVSATAITAWSQTQQRPIELADIMAWKGISGTALSDNGEWFGYRIGPAEGDSEVIIRQTKSDKEYKFSVGEIPQAPAIFGPGDLANLPVTGPAVCVAHSAGMGAATCGATGAPTTDP